MYKLLVLDLDGTLTNSQKEITPYTRSVLTEVQQQGIRIVLASGRPLEGVRPLAEELCLTQYSGYIMAFNGGLIVECETNRHLCETFLNPSSYPRLYEKCRGKDFAILTYLDGHIASEDINNRFVKENAMRNRMPLLQLDNLLQQITFPEPKWLIVGDADKLSKLEKELQTLFHNEFNIYRSEPYFLEIMPPGIEKANGLKFITDCLGIQAKDILACGDSYNDISMLRYAGLGIAMANADKEVKEVADYITLSNDKDGVAHAVKKFCLQIGNNNNKP